MFEQGAELKERHGHDNVFDFSLGNPNLEPPILFKTALLKATQAKGIGHHAYMPNSGYMSVREAVAGFVSSEQGIKLAPDHVIMTCGAAGALNVILKTILNSGDEVITPAPYFPEYNFYVDNHGGVLKTVPTKPDFSLDLDSIEEAITQKTRAILINSPHNPTGQVYDEKELIELGELLNNRIRKGDQIIYLISDEPYRKIVYDNVRVPSILSCYSESLIATSYSKDLSIPGERIGFLVVNPEARHREDLLAGMNLANRILGFVNAPALMQRTIQDLQGVSVDVKFYQEKRDMISEGLERIGYRFERPKGAFYLFVQSPIDDDVRFVQALQEELILTVPGSGFGCAGYFRIAFCVDDDTIVRALPGFERAFERVR